MLNGLKISANVYTPANFDETNQYPAVVVAHPNGGVKEQVAGLYSQKLAELMAGKMADTLYFCIMERNVTQWEKYESVSAKSKNSKNNQCKILMFRQKIK